MKLTIVEENPKTVDGHCMSQIVCINLYGLF